MVGGIQALGGVIVAVALVDVFLTVLYARGGAGLLTPYLNGGAWRLFRGIGQVLPRGGARLMSFAGPTILVLTVAVWVLLLTLGFGLIVWPALGTAVQTSHGSTPTGFAAALYYGGYTLTTLGFGDLVPKTGAFRLLTVLIAGAGFSVLTLSLTYFMSVYSALVARNAFALKLHHSAAETGDAAEWLARMGAGGDFDAASKSEVDTVATHVLRLLQTHHAYPVLHYFRTPEVEYAMARIALLAVDGATLARTALDQQRYRSFIEGTALAALSGGGLRLLKETSVDFLSRRAVDAAAEADEAAWRARYTAGCRRLAEAELAVEPEPSSGAERYVALRREWDAYIRAFAGHMAHRWSEIAPHEAGLCGSPDAPGATL